MRAQRPAAHWQCGRRRLRSEDSPRLRHTSQLLRRRIVAFGALGTGRKYLLLFSLVARANNIQSFRCKALPLRPFWKGCRDLSQNSLCECPFVTTARPVARPRSCDDLRRLLPSPSHFTRASSVAYQFPAGGPLSATPTRSVCNETKKKSYRPLMSRRTVVVRHRDVYLPATRTAEGVARDLRVSAQDSEMEQFYYY